MLAARNIRIRKALPESEWKQGYEAGRSEAHAAAERIYGRELESLQDAYKALIKTVKEQDVKLDRLKTIRNSYAYEARSTRHTTKALWYAKSILEGILDSDFGYTTEDMAMHEEITTYINHLVEYIAEREREARDINAKQMSLPYTDEDDDIPF